jgi:hypothetical protein
MGAGLISIFAAIGSATWLFNRLQRNSGNNTQQSLIGAGLFALLVFLIFFVMLNFAF